MAKNDRDHIRRLREEANAIRKQEQAKRRRNRMLAQIGIIVGAVVVIGGIVALVVFGPQLLNPRPDFEASSTTGVTSSVTGEVTDQPIATTERGGIMVGNPEAPAAFTYWYDYSCPHCVQYHAATNSTYQDLIATGQVKVEYVPINYVAPFGAQAGAAVLATVQHQPELYFAVSDGLFSIPGETQSSWTGPDYASILPSFGVTNEAALDQVSEGAFLGVISDSTRDARANGVAGTPSVSVNGEMQAEIPSGPALYDLAIANGAAIENPLTATAPGEQPAA